MDDDKLDELTSNLTAHTPGYEVRINTDITRGIGFSAEAADEGARARSERLHRGERVAHVIVNGRRTFSGIVNRAQVAALIAAGARDLGSAHNEESALAAFAERDAIEPAARG